MLNPWNGELAHGTYLRVNKTRVQCMYVIFAHICAPFSWHIPIRRGSLNKRYLIIGQPVA